MPGSAQVLINSFTHRRESGDTIVEVLIAIAVVSSVLAITYSIMNRNLLTMRDNQERTEAMKLAQGQIEALRARWGTVDGREAIEEKGGNGFCVSPDAPSEAESLPSLNGAAPAANPGDEDLSEYVPECVSSDIYHIGIRRQSGATYQVTVRWDSLNGGRGQVALAYMLGE